MDEKIKILKRNRKKTKEKFRKKFNKIIKNKKIFIIGIIIVLFIIFFIVLINILNIHLIEKIINYYKINKIDGRIFYCTVYNNEAERAYILIWRLYDYVDKFIIVISNVTHTGLPKTFSFNSFEKDIKPYMDKIDIVNFDNICNTEAYPEAQIHWCREKSQRDYAKTYIEEKYNPTEKDLLIVTDIDEILTREGIEYIKKNPPNDYKHIKGAIYFPYYYHRIEDWDSGYVIRYNKNMNTLSYYRVIEANNSNTIKYEHNPNKALITHCTYCFKSVEEYKNKLSSFTHIDYNVEPYNTNNYIFKNLYCREKINRPGQGYDEPYEGWRHLLPDDERLKYLIDRSYKYNISETTYTEKDLETLCGRTFNRTPFE